MLRTVAQFFLGWPGIVASAACASWGVFRREWRLTALGLLFALLPLTYLVGGPRYRAHAITVGILYTLGVVASVKGKRVVALSLIVPFFVLEWWLVVMA